MYQVIASPLRSNYCYQQIRKNDWKYDDKFESLNLVTPSMNEWTAVLKINGKTIALENVDQDVWVDGIKLSFAQTLNVRDYIRKTYFPRPSRAVYNGKGERVSNENYSIFEPAV